MATKKNTHTKKAAPKKTTWKKVKGRAKAKPLTWRFYAVAVGIFTIAVATMIVIALLTASIVAKNENQARLERIQSIYKSLELTDEYLPVRSDVFGEKRVYAWDKNSTHSSVVEYIHGDTVTNTVADLDAKIKAAGFAFIDEPYPYPGMQSIQYHYKSKDGEYIRMTVQSKPYWDAVASAQAMGKEPIEEVRGIDTNQGPATVIIKVNLDDNNE